MSFAVRDVIPLTRARATLSELADEVKTGAEKIITKNGESYVALIDADKLDYYHELEKWQQIQDMEDDVVSSLTDVLNGRVLPAQAAIDHLRQHLPKPRSVSRKR
jgi:prevent-host-death family protein